MIMIFCRTYSAPTGVGVHPIRRAMYRRRIVCTTNLYSQVDLAALRRFTFKLEFLPLNIHQRWEMFQNEAGLRSTQICERRQADYEERLAFMKNLAPGDFATVKR